MVNIHQGTSISKTFNVIFVSSSCQFNFYQLSLLPTHGKWSLKNGRHTIWGQASFKRDCEWIPLLPGANLYLHGRGPDTKYLRSVGRKVWQGKFAIILKVNCCSYYHAISYFRCRLCLLKFVVARHTRPEGHFKVWATNYYSSGHCHLLLVLKQGHSLYRPLGCRLGYHPSEAWLVEQKALPTQLYEAIHEVSWLRTQESRPGLKPILCW